jgi:uncharacterized SAM-binding protein YcdF (DUF218 family)
MLYLAKFLTQLAYPLSLCLLLVPLGLLLRRGRWRRMGATLITFGLGWLLLWSLPLPSFWLRASLERKNPPRALADFPPTAAIIVLGGGIEPPRSGWRDYPDLSSAADRVWFAARLYHAGRAPLVVLSGGTLDQSLTATSEASAMATFIEDLGVPASALLLEDQSRTTSENAINTIALLHERGINEALLVTSAMHMPRALGVFRKLGLNVIAAPTDFEAVPPVGPWFLRWMPDSDALDGSSRALKEYAGYWVYWLRNLAA